MLLKFEWMDERVCTMQGEEVKMSQILHAIQSGHMYYDDGFNYSVFRFGVYSAKHGFIDEIRDRYVRVDAGGNPYWDHLYEISDTILDALHVESAQPYDYVHENYCITYTLLHPSLGPCVLKIFRPCVPVAGPWSPPAVPDPGHGAGVRRVTPGAPGAPAENAI